jgi:hypothetical protein
VKGSTAAAIIRTLKKKRFEGMLAQLATESNGSALVKMCRFWHSSTQYSESALLLQLDLTKGQYYHYVEVIGSFLLQQVEGKKEAMQLEGTLQMARNLVFASEFEPAIDLIKAGIREASQVEDFNLVLNFWELVEAIIPQPKIEGMDAKTARQLRNNLNAYDDLLADFQEAAGEYDAAKRKDLIESIFQSPRLVIESQALSKRALYLFLKIKSSCLIHLRQYHLGIPILEHLLGHVSFFPWTVVDQEYITAKETKTLIQLLQLTKQFERLRSKIDSFNDVSFRNYRAEQERTFLRFPTSFGMAIDVGDQEAVLRAYHEFQQLIDSYAERFDAPFVTENLYYCAYAMLTVREIDAMGKVLKLLRAYGKPNFKPRYFTLTRFLEILFFIEIEDWEEALRLIKNLRAGNGFLELPGLKEAITFLARVCLMSQSNQADEIINSVTIDFKSLKEALMGQDFLDYFDFLVWIEARELGGSMIEILKHRATKQTT